MRKTEIKTIKKRVAEEFNVTVEEIMGKAKPDYISFPRQVAMALAHDIDPLKGLKFVGEAFRRDHSSVIYSKKSVKNRCATEPPIRERVNRLRLAFNLEPYE